MPRRALRIRRWAGTGPVALLFACVSMAPAPVHAQGKPLTIDVLYEPEKKIDFNGTAPTGLTWIDDGRYHWARTDPKTRRTEHLQVEALTGKATPLFDASKLEEALGRLPGVTAEEASRLARRPKYVMNSSKTALVVTAASDLYHFDFTTGKLTRLTEGEGPEEEPSFSPDGRRVAFVRGHNLHVAEVAMGRERALTTDGSPDVLNGKLDWVYQEEIYGRGDFKGYWWSADSSRIGYLRLHEARVPRFTLLDDVTTEPVVETERYPKVGDPNPEVRLGIVSAEGGPTAWVDLSPYARDEPLIVAVAWSPRGDLAYQVQDRAQTWLDLNLAGADGTSRTLFRETTRAWVEPQGNPHWLKDGSFLWASERTGWKHLYHYRSDGTLAGRVTQGTWEARTLHGVDERGPWVYFSGTERSHTGGDVYRVGRDGRGLKRLSATAGTHEVSFNPSFSMYLDTWSDLETPKQVRLHRADGTEARVVDANPVPALAEYRLSRPELLKVPTRDGFEMEAILIKPPDFDPARRYPVYQHTYAGPHAPRVRNVWEGTNGLFHQLLAQRGVVVWICDNRTASGKGAVSAWPAYKRLGEVELQDIEDGLAWLKAQPWVDASRIGINGWSYGGFMVTYALTHSRSFAMGIAGGAVTDWRNYDSIYTERYMGLLSQNEEGYRKTAPRLAAGGLHGKLLLLHGSVDDNVHPSNTTQMAYELQKAGKPFGLMLYPRSRHAVTDPLLVKHLRATMLAFVEETLLGR